MHPKRFFPGNTRRPPNVLTVPEMERLLACPDLMTAEGLRDAAVLWVLADSGIRKAELLGLRWGDIDTKTREVFICNGKGGKQRYTFIGKRCARIVDAYIRRIRFRKKVKGQGKGHGMPFFIKFWGRDARALDYNDLRDIIRKYAFQAGLRSNNVTAHTFRHSAASAWYQTSHDIELVQMLLGHAFIDTTQIYVHSKQVIFPKPEPNERLDYLIAPEFPARYNQMKIAAYTPAVEAVPLTA